MPQRTARIVVSIVGHPVRLQQTLDFGLLALQLHATDPLQGPRHIAPMRAQQAGCREHFVVAGLGDRVVAQQRAVVGQI